MSCCDSTTNSDVIQGNKRFLENIEKDIKGKVWNEIKTMCITGKDGD